MPKNRFGARQVCLFRNQFIPELYLNAESSKKNKVTELIQNAATSQIVSAVVDSFRTPTFERPASNSFGRFLWSSCGAFFSLLFAPPIFLYLGPQSVFPAFIEWVATISLGVHIGIAVPAVYCAAVMVGAAIVGGAVSGSVTEKATPAELIVHGYKFTLRCIMYVCVLLLVLLIFRSVLNGWTSKT